MTTKNTDVNPNDAIAKDVVAALAGKRADDNGYFETRGIIAKTRGGNLTAKSEETRVVAFFNNNRKAFVKVGTDINATDLAANISKAATLKAVFAPGLSDAQINQRCSNVAKALKASFPTIIPQTAEFKHAHILSILKAAAKMVVVNAQEAPIKVIKKADVVAEPAKQQTRRRQPAAQLEVHATV